MTSIFPPDPRSTAVSLIARKLGLADAGLSVPFESIPNTSERFCFQNVTDVVAHRGGEIVYGWLVWQHDELFVEAEHHAIWRKATGELVCITPQTPPEKFITFIPDPSAIYDLSTQLRTDNIRIALTNDSRLEEFFKACSEQTEVMNAARRRCGPGPTVELLRSETIRFSELEMRKAALMNQIVPFDLQQMQSGFNQVIAQRRIGKVGRNEPCPCGSGKKYKKCHGA